MCIRDRSFLDAMVDQLAVGARRAVAKAGSFARESDQGANDRSPDADTGWSAPQGMISIATILTCWPCLEFIGAQHLYIGNENHHAVLLVVAAFQIEGNRLGYRQITQSVSYTHLDVYKRQV